jgi:photosystem II stability/assembly factor-like uncharacterized protein
MSRSNDHVRRSRAAATVLLCAAVCGWAIAAPEMGAAPPRPTAVEAVRAGIPHDALYDITLEATDGIAVGHHGVILASGDSGATWAEVANVPTSKALLGVAAMGSKAIAVGVEGTILVTEDRIAWRKVDGGTATRLLKVALAPDGNAVAVGAFGTILWSGDWGSTWRPVGVDWEAVLEEPGYEPHLYDVQFDVAGRVLIAGEFGLVITSTDRGTSWQRKHKGEVSLFALFLTEDGTGFAVGHEGTILRSRDNGETWEVRDSGTDANLLDVWASRHGEVVVTGIRSLLRSIDGGDSFFSVRSPLIDRSFKSSIAVALDHANVANGTLVREVVYVAGQWGVIARVVE